MPYQVYCPSCQHLQVLQDAGVGRPAKCVRCGLTFAVAVPIPVEGTPPLAPDTGPDAPPRAPREDAAPVDDLAVEPASECEYQPGSFRPSKGRRPPPTSARMSPQNRTFRPGGLRSP